MGVSPARQCLSRIDDSASVQAVTRVNAEQAFDEAIEVKHYLTAFFTFFIPVSLLDLESPFLRPTHGCWRAARAETVKADRRFAPASCSIVFRPCLDRPEHGGTIVVGTTGARGARYSGHEELAPQPCIR